MKLQLGGVESKDRSISSSTFSSVDRETDGVVEGQTEGGVSFLTTFTAIKQIGLEELDRREQCYRWWHISITFMLIERVTDGSKQRLRSSDLSHM